MSVRYVAVLATPDAGATVPGVDRDVLRTALLEDVCDLVAALPLVEAAMVACPPGQPGLGELVAPGTPVLEVTAGSTAAATDAALGALAGLGADQAAVLAGDAPDLPALLVGKLFRGLGSADAAVVPAAGGGLVAVAARLPPAGWFAAAGCGLDTPDALDLLRTAAPTRRSLSVAPGWHRVRTAADLARLDPGLEGWDATRAVLSGR